MELSIDGRDLVVTYETGATVADLARAAGVPVDRVGPGPMARLAELGLPRGVELAAHGTPGVPAGAAAVAVIGGLDAGRRAVLGAGSTVVGRAPGSHLAPLAPSVSRRHAEVTVDHAGTVTVADLGSRNGTWLVPSDGRAPEVAAGRRPIPMPTACHLRAGALDIGIVLRCPDDSPVTGAAPRRTHAGTVAFNRPPRAATPPAPPPVIVPAPPSPPTPPPPLGVVGLVAPIVMAAVLVALMRNPVFALLALLSPVVALGNHVEGKRRTRRARRRAAVARAADLHRFAADLTLAVDAELARRREIAPDPAEVVRRAEQPSTRLWERRRHHADALVVRVGVGTIPWDPPLDGDHHPRPLDADAVVAAAATLPACPATVCLADGGVVGVVGPRQAALAVARSLVCQLAVHHGPADVPVAVAVEVDARTDWDWTKWLPHVDDPAGTGRWLAAGRDEADAIAAAIASRAGAPPLVVVDGDELLEGRRAPVRRLLDGPASGVVVAATVDRLPAACTAVVVVDADGTAELRLPATGLRVRGLRAAGMADDVARRCARAVARFDDPELDVAGTGLPDTVRLLGVLGLDGSDLAAAVADRWRRAGDDPRPVAPIGVAADGIVDVDLVADGPHGLVAGTTGAGKSELLRTLVAGLAAGSSPEHITFVLVDFKGGSAFDACARLPHVVGLVTDLDDTLAERALRCLDAELRHRERVLREAGAEDLHSYRGRPRREPLPRLVVVVDEFATLKAELPDFVDALVGVAQRGRSLGVHLVLATQRPAGAVSDNIRANTNLRIALRVQDASDSTDVVDVADAAQLPRHRPGRACIRLGPGEVVAVQTALATSMPPRARRAGVEVRPFEFGPGLDASAPPMRSRPRGPSDLDRLVDACAAAWAATNGPSPRRPWPDPLPTDVDRAALDLGDVALADDPDAQAQVPLRWRLDDGNLAIYGVGGSGTTTSLLAAGLALAEEHGPDELHLYAVALGAGELGALSALPHTGAVIGAGERERQVRLVRLLRRELDYRRAMRGGGGTARIVVLVDGVGAFLAQFDDVVGLEVLDAFERVFADGAEVGIHVAVTADRAGALPSAFASLVRQRWVHRLADPLDAGALGVAGRVPPLVAGRFVDVVSGLVAHTARPVGGWAPAVESCAARWAGRPATAVAIGELPSRLQRSQLPSAPAATVDERPWRLAIGVADDDLGVAALSLWEGDHVLVAGPGRSGRTAALASIGAAAVEAGARVLAARGRRPWSVPGAELVPVEALASFDNRPTFVLVDDAESVDDPSGVLARLVEHGPGSVHVVAAARAETVRGLYNHWTRAVRRSRVGLLLRPHLDLDGELLATPLPRRVGVPLVAGRGFLVAEGAARLVQVAMAD